MLPTSVTKATSVVLLEAAPVDAVPLEAAPPPPHAVRPRTMTAASANAVIFFFIVFLLKYKKIY